MTTSTRTGQRLATAAEPFLGRRRELATLARLLEGVDDRAASVFIEGEAGVGKTSLLTAFLQTVEQRGAEVKLASCYPVEQAAAYAPFVELYPAVFRAGGDNANTAADLGADAAARRAHYVHGLAEAILASLGDAPGVMCVEDVHWADIGSLLLLNQLLDSRRAGLMLVCTGRPETTTSIERHELIARLQQRSLLTELSGLGPAEVEELFRQIASPGLATQEEVEALTEFTNGNPLLLKESLGQLQKGGLLTAHSLREAIRRGRTPLRLAEAIDWRLDSLSQQTREMIGAGAVLGAEFETDVLARAAGLPARDVEDEIATCQEEGLLSGDGTRFRFVHPSFAARVYERLKPSERRHLHARAAAVLAASSAPVPIAELARHLALGAAGTDRKKAVKLCFQTAEEAEAMFAYETAAQYWELALRCVGRAKTLRADIDRRLGWALWSARNWERAALVWKEAVALYEELGDRAHAGELALALGDVYRWRQELAESERWLTRALAALNEPGVSRARALALLGGIACLRRDYERGIAFLRDALHDGSGAAIDPLVGYWASYGYYLSGDVAASHEVAEQALQEALDQKHSRGTALLAGSLFQYELFNLRPTRARAYFRLMEDASPETDATAFTYVFVSRSLLDGYAGRWRSIIKGANDWQARVRLAGGYQAATARLLWSVAQLHLGDAATAREGLLSASDALERMTPLAWLYLAIAELRLDRADEAASLVERYLRANRGRPRSADDGALFADAVAGLERRDWWQLGYEFLNDEKAHLSGPYAPISVQRVLGRLATKLGLWAEAATHFEKAISALSAGKAKWELSQSLLDYAAMRRARRRRGDLNKATSLQFRAAEILGDLRIPMTAAIPQAGGDPFGLTGREREVLDLLARAYRNQEIAEAFTISPGTVRRHIENILGKMGATNRTDAVVLGMRAGLIGPTPGADGQGTEASAEDRRLAG
ncbi:MAG: AAA family ATPase [Dehalococcoidia bacterium]